MYLNAAQLCAWHYLGYFSHLILFVLSLVVRRVLLCRSSGVFLFFPTKFCSYAESPQELAFSRRSLRITSALVMNLGRVRSLQISYFSTDMITFFTLLSIIVFMWMVRFMRQRFLHGISVSHCFSSQVGVIAITISIIIPCIIGIADTFGFKLAIFDHFSQFKRSNIVLF